MAQAKKIVLSLSSNSSVRGVPTISKEAQQAVREAVSASPTPDSDAAWSKLAASVNKALRAQKLLERGYFTGAGLRQFVTK